MADSLEFLQQFRRMFKCDSVRLSKPGKRMFLIIGWKRHTSQDGGFWVRNGDVVHFDYIHEQVIASGDTRQKLLESAREYKRLMGLTMEQYLKEAV